MSNHFKNFVQDFETLNFDVYGLTSSFCNSLRRIMISEVETIGFHSSYVEDSPMNSDASSASIFFGLGRKLIASIEYKF